SAISGHVLPWHDHKRWPVDFVVNGITVDQRNPHIIYAAGCMLSDTEAHSYTSVYLAIPSLTGVQCNFNGTPPRVLGHALLRSSDGGHTWQDVLDNHNVM